MVHNILYNYYIFWNKSSLCLFSFSWLLVFPSLCYFCICSSFLRASDGLGLLESLRLQTKLSLKCLDLTRSRFLKSSSWVRKQKCTSWPQRELEWLHCWPQRLVLKLKWNVPSRGPCTSISRKCKRKNSSQTNQNIVIQRSALHIFLRLRAVFSESSKTFLVQNIKSQPRSSFDLNYLEKQK